jgi:hypothetical protein
MHPRAAVMLNFFGASGAKCRRKPLMMMVLIGVTVSMCETTFDGDSPFGLDFQKFDIEPVQTADRYDVKKTFADLLNGGDPRQGQEETEMVREVLKIAGGRVADRQPIGLEVRPIGRKDESRLHLGRDLVWLQRGNCLRDLAGRTDRDEDVVRL